MSRGPSLIGLCRDDIVGVANAVNAAQERLIYAEESGDEGWYGSWAEILMFGSRLTPYVTLPREVARIEYADVCTRPVNLSNQFQEYIRFGNGRLPKECRQNFECLTTAFTRNDAITFLDPPTAPFYLQAFALDDADVAAAKRVLFQGVDSNGNVVYTQNGVDETSGEYVTLTQPFAASVNAYSKLTGIQKDLTVGAVQIMSVDATTGVSTLILTMEPGEQSSRYKRYYFNNLPCTCPIGQNCVTPQAIPIHAIVKLDLIPAAVDQDYLLIQSLEALIEECQAARMSGVDGMEAKAESANRHKQAVKFLNGQLTHYVGKNKPAIYFAPFGSARLERVRIGMI
jgi:hypothetical protein